MNISEMHTSLYFSLDKLGTLNYPNLLPEEGDLILNQAQDRIIKQRYGLNNNQRQSFEGTQKRIEDLKELIRTVLAVPTSAKSDNMSDNSYNVELQDDHWFLIWEKAIITVPNCNTTIRIPYKSYNIQSRAAGDGGGDMGIPDFITTSGREVKVIPTTHLEVERNLDDAFKGPDKDQILRLMYRNRSELIVASGHTLRYYIYRYIKQPVKMDIFNNVDCELSEHLHQEIVDEAVKIALENIESKRTGTFIPVIDDKKE